MNGTNFFCNFLKFFKINSPWIGSKPGNDQFWFFSQCNGSYFIVIQEFCVFIYPIRNDLKQFPGKVIRITMSQVATTTKLKTHEFVSRRKKRKKYRLISRTSRKGLDIHVLSTKKHFS